MINKNLFILYLLLIFNWSQSQTDTKAQELYAWSDAIIGQQNTGLFNGTTYVEKHRMINQNHKFFEDFNFVNGFLVYDNAPYDNILMKYNIFEDQLILKYSFSPAEPIILIDHSKLTKFKIGEHEFENLNIKTIDGESLKGFFENIYENNSIKLFKKHQKRIRNKTNDKIRYHEFIDDNIYLAHIEEDYTLIKNPKKIAKQFPNYKAVIKEVPKVKKGDEFTDYDAYVIAVIKAIANSKTISTSEE